METCPKTYRSIYRSLVSKLWATNAWSLLFSEQSRPAAAAVPSEEEAGVGWVGAEVERSISSTQPSSSWNNPHVKGASFSSLNHHWLHPPQMLMCVLKLLPDTWNQLSENNDKRRPVQLTYRSLRSRTGMSPTAPESWTTASSSAHWKNMVTRVTSAVNTNLWVSIF